MSPEWRFRIARNTQAGIPRMVNRVCEKSLMYAFQQQKRLIDDYMIKYVVEHEMLGTVTG